MGLLPKYLLVPLEKARRSMRFTLPRKARRRRGSRDEWISRTLVPDCISHALPSLTTRLVPTRIDRRNPPRDFRPTIRGPTLILSARNKGETSKFSYSQCRAVMNDLIVSTSSGGHGFNVVGYSRIRYIIQLRLLLFIAFRIL